MRLASGSPGNLTLMETTENRVEYQYKLDLKEESFDDKGYSKTGGSQSNSFDVDFLPEVLKAPLVFEILASFSDEQG